jgi:hypothetical protein
MNFKNNLDKKPIIGLLLMSVLGLLPLFAFLLLDFMYSYQIALLGALIIFAAYFIIDIFILKDEPPYTIIVSSIVFILLISGEVLKPFDVLYRNNSALVLELIMVIIFYVFLFFKDYFRTKITLRKDQLKDFLLVRFDSDITVFKGVTIIVTLHLFIVLFYNLLPIDYHSPETDLFIYYIFLFILIAIYFAYQFGYLYLLNRQYFSEMWLPVIDEKGVVHGKIALSISQSYKNKYLHPFIRIALIHKGKLFLKNKQSLDGKENQLDHPFETHLKYKESLEEGVKRAFKETRYPDTLLSHYLFRYVFKNEETNRLIYVYVANAHSDLTTEQLPSDDGKWWTCKQIDENLNTGLFSECFEKEYELLNNTVLLADKLMWNTETD